MIVKIKKERVIYKVFGLILIGLVAASCGSSGGEGRDCRGDLAQIKADACYPLLYDLAVVNDVSEQSFLEVCRNASSEIYWSTRSCIEEALAQGRCVQAFDYYWRGADGNCNPIN